MKHTSRWTPSAQCLFAVSHKGLQSSDAFAIIMNVLVDKLDQLVADPSPWPMHRSHTFLELCHRLLQLFH